jgi:hypothetical protein
MVVLRMADRTYKRWQALPERDRKRLRSHADEVRRRAIAVRQAPRRGEALKELGQAAAELARQIRSV